MNELYVEKAKCIKDLTSPSSNATVMELVNEVLLSDYPITNNIEHVGEAGEDKAKITRKEICPAQDFLKKAKEEFGEPNSNNAGMDFAVEYLNFLRNYAKKEKAEETITHDIEELLKTFEREL
jgi:hypothetical protein